MSFYIVDGSDRVVRAREFPAPDVGAPLPAIVADEGRVVLTYLANVADPDWDGTYTTSIGPDTHGAVVVVRLQGANIYWGWPNDEVISAHPLYRRGLQSYAVWEVLQSSWIRQLEHGNSMHPMHRPEDFADLRHLIFAFHDSVFEVVTRQVVVQIQPGSIQQLITEIAERFFVT